MHCTHRIAHKHEYKSIKSIKFTCLFEKLQHFAFLMRPQMTIRPITTMNKLSNSIRLLSVFPSTSTTCSSTAFCVNVNFIQNKQRYFNHFDFFHSAFFFSRKKKKFFIFFVSFGSHEANAQFSLFSCCWCIESNAN